MSCICPGCGLNIQSERVIEDGPFTYDPTVPAFLIDGSRITCRPQVREVLGSVMQARGRTLGFDVLADRLGSVAAAPSRLIDVALYDIRRIFAATPYPCPVERIRGKGLRWSMAAA